MLHVQGDRSRFSSCLVSANLEWRILDAYDQARPEATERDWQRKALEGQPGRLGDLVVLGDLSKTESEARRAEPRVELARVTEADAHGRPEVLERRQRYLLDAGAAWDEADAGARNRLARALYNVFNDEFSTSVHF